MADEQIEMLLAKLAESEVGSEQKEVREAITSFLARKKERATPQKLIQMLTLLNKDHVFQKGQLVRWKKGLKDRRIPREDEPAIVVRVLTRSYLMNKKSRAPRISKILLMLFWESFMRASFLCTTIIVTNLSHTNKLSHL